LELELLVVAFAPIVFFVWFISRRDKYEREPRKLILKTFFVGALLMAPVIVAEFALSILLPESKNPAIMFLHVLLVIALIEESSKYLAIKLSVYNSPHFNETMDGIVYGGVAGLGFAAPENLLYVLESGPIVGIFRAVLSVPSHAIWGSIIGYYLAREKLVSKSENKVLRGLGVAIILHTIFDYGIFAFGSLPGLMIASITVVASWFLFFRLSRSALLVSPFRPPSHPLISPKLSWQPPRYCIDCGSSIGASDQFCLHCGARQRPIEVSGESP
jgi:RsiW-degrading membrane proteinase PrsW (M82 family)